MSLNDKKKMVMTGKMWEEIIPSADVKEFIKKRIEDLEAIKAGTLTLNQAYGKLILEAGEGLINGI